MAAMFRVKFAETIRKFLAGEKEELNYYMDRFNAKHGDPILDACREKCEIERKYKDANKSTNDALKNVITTQLPPHAKFISRGFYVHKETKLTHGCTGINPDVVKSSRGATKRQSARDMFTKWEKVLATQGNEMIERGIVNAHSTDELMCVTESACDRLSKMRRLFLNEPEPLA